MDGPEDRRACGGRKVAAMRRRRGFTLTEMLVVVGIFILLLALLMPALEKAREQARRAKCRAQLREIVRACMMYADDDPNGIYVYDLGDTGTRLDNLMHLYPKYMTSLKLAICPSTAHIIRTDPANLVTAGDPIGSTNPAMIGRPRDLSRFDGGGANSSAGGHSYEVRAYMWAGTWPDGRYIPSNTVKTKSNIRYPSKVKLIEDGMDEMTVNGVSYPNNWPCPYHNHGAAGVNVGFCDGHVEWVPRGRQLLQTFYDSYYAAPNVTVP